MNTRTLPIGGAAVLWKLGKATHKTALKQGLDTIGLGQFAPEERSYRSCVRQALTDVFQAPADERYVVRSSKDGFVVARERPKHDAVPGESWSDVVVSCRVRDDETDFEIAPYDGDKYIEMTGLVRSLRENRSSTSVSMSLVAIVEHLDGVPLRQAGGVYWLNENRLDCWALVAEAVERAGADNQVEAVLSVANESTLRAVGRALTEEVTAAIADMDKEIATGAFTPDACMRRLNRAKALGDKVKAYESAFEAPYTALSQAVAEMGQRIALATLTASASL